MKNKNVLVVLMMFLLGSSAFGQVNGVFNKATVTTLSNTQRNTTFGVGVPCHNWGDSITAGYYAAYPGGPNPNSPDVTRSYANLLDAFMGWTCINAGASGSQLMDASQIDAMLATSIQPNSISTLLTGANDMRSTFCSGCVAGMSTTAAQNQYMSELLSAAAWLALPSTSKTSGQACPSLPNNPSCVFTGTWVTSPAFGAMQTAVPSSTVTLYLVGSTIYLASLEQGGNSSTYTVTIDGTAVPSPSSGVFASAGSITRTFNDASRNYSQSLIRVGGLPETQHTVVFTCTSADSSNPCYFAWGGSNGASMATTGGSSHRTGPYVFLGNTIRATGAGYSANGGSDVIVAQFDAIAKEVANELASDGLQVQLVDSSSAMNPNNASLYYSDGFHPSTLGHQTLALAFEDAITGSLVPNDRGALQVLHDVNACTFNGGFNVGGCSVGIQRGDLGAARSGTTGSLFLGLDGGGLFRTASNAMLLQGAAAGLNHVYFGAQSSTFPALNLSSNFVQLLDGANNDSVRMASNLFDATTGYRINAQAPAGHSLCGNGSNYVDCVDYYWTATGCTTGTGQPVNCSATTSLPGAMPDANWQFFCTTDSGPTQASDFYCSPHLPSPLPTAAGSTLLYHVVQTMQNGGVGGTPTVYFHAHHD